MIDERLAVSRTGKGTNSACYGPANLLFFSISPLHSLSMAVRLKDHLVAVISNLSTFFPRFRDKSRINGRLAAPEKSNFAHGRILFFFFFFFFSNGYLIRRCCRCWEKAAQKIEGFSCNILLIPRGRIHQVAEGKLRGSFPNVTDSRSYFVRCVCAPIAPETRTAERGQVGENGDV